MVIVFLGVFCTVLAILCGGLAFLLLKKSKKYTEASLVIANLQTELKILRTQSEHAREREKDFQTKIIELEKQITHLQERSELRQDFKEFFLSQAKNSLTEVSHEIIKLNAEKNKTLNDEFIKHFGEIQQKFATIREYLMDDRRDIKLIKQSFTSSNSTGFHGETHLLNSLKNLGLMEGLDFCVQFSTSLRLRPDCVIFLPNNAIFVIDSKSSTYFLEQETGIMHENERLNKISERMNTHLNQLAAKNYIEEIKQHFKEKQVGEVYLFMFVPSEIFVEKIIQADPKFNLKAREKGIILCGPSSLQYALQIARENIKNYKIDLEYKSVIMMVSELLGRFSTLAGYAKDIANSTNKLNISLSKFTSSFNRNLLPQARKIAEITSLPSGKELPEKISEMGLDTIEQINE
jgi:DNA recombination protein RmuC